MAIHRTCIAVKCEPVWGFLGTDGIFVEKFTKFKKTNDANSLTTLKNAAVTMTRTTLDCDMMNTVCEMALAENFARQKAVEIVRSSPKCQMNELNRHKIDEALVFNNK